MQLSEVVPFGRNMTEYARMFALTDADLDQRRFLDAGGGPSSFTAQITARGGTAVAADPIFRFSREEIARRISETTDDVIGQVREKRSNYHFGDGDGDFPDENALRRARTRAMQIFLDDYESGLRSGRYVKSALPELPFADDAFDLALCSHLLFLYSDHLDMEAHLAALREMLRVAPEVRVFPLVKLDGSPSPWLAPVCEELRADGVTCEQYPVPVRVLRGSDRAIRFCRGREE